LVLARVDRWLLAGVFLLVLLAAAPAARAQCSAGLCFLEVGTPDMGLSAAGAGARAQDAATAFFNPAGMTGLDRAELLGGAFGAKLELEFESSSDTVAPFGGDDGGDAGGWTPGMGGYLVLPIADRPLGEEFAYLRDLRFGFALNGVFGGNVDYSSSWLARTFVTELNLVVLNLLPSVAFRVHDRISVGVGANVKYANLDEYRLRALPGAGSPTLRVDDADDWGASAVVGLLFEPWDATRIGVRYSSAADLKLEKDSFPAFRFDFTVPQNVDVSVFHQLTPNLALLADAAWTDWSEFSQNSVQVGPVDVTIDREWDDTWRIGAGAQYRIGERWLVAGGFSYDSSAVDSNRRTPDAPVSEQWRFSTGLQFALSENVTLGSSFTFLYLDEPRIRGVNLPGIGAPAPLDGKYEEALGYVFGLSLRWSFCSPLPWVECPATAAAASKDRAG
jgi:long-chain fatty acid transport protein